ncbi:VWA domain-containing protein [Cuneatibacter sp. NSJ-177]|uniref:VWA domain-containing protein n=1 Tax=Cuneatibacter sp. NSJ-177 TaxID=2931401 RepID=UPI001FD2FB4C|nr:VWA domain-containing protein [Cuneatibacter sp. NSJ-177]MCJ7835504.1 VWA domain-containing protein [Cuneatibacter sp. NSJ-177]
MFTGFFYYLRAGGFSVGPVEWMTLMEALDQDLIGSSLDRFYWISRAALVKSEVEYDRYDQLFFSYFREVEEYAALSGEMKNWLENPRMRKTSEEVEALPLPEKRNLKELMDRLSWMKKLQEGEHNQGNFWIGAGGKSNLGHSAQEGTGLRLAGSSKNRRALGTCGERKFQDFRKNAVITSRQFQLALRRLRQLSEQSNQEKSELDVEETIRQTGDHGGLLTLAYRRPRKNQIALLLLMDCGGSMRRHSMLCSQLFQAVDQSTHFRDVKVYYFHNCVYDELFMDPKCEADSAVSTQWVLNQYGADYRVAVVGDGTMSPEELFDVGGSYQGKFNQVAGIEWLRRFQKKYTHMVWINPSLRERMGRGFLVETLYYLKEMFPTYPLTLEGLEGAMKKLLRGQSKE